MKQLPCIDRWMEGADGVDNDKNIVSSLLSTCVKCSHFAKHMLKLMFIQLIAYCKYGILCSSSSSPLFILGLHILANG